VGDALEAELDRLFQLPLAELVEARNTAVDQLRRAGDKAGAARIKSVKRPTPAAWALNQVHFHSAGLLDRARAEVEALRELHATDGVSGSQLMAAVQRQRQATQLVVEAALACCRAAGLPSGPVQQRRIFGTLQGWLTGAGDEAPGRMTHDLESSGFDAITAVGEVMSASEVTLPASTAEQAALTRARTALAADRADLTQARSALAAEQAELARAESARAAELTRARTAFAESERAALRARRERERLAPHAERARGDRERAQAELSAAEQRLTVARQQLAEREAALSNADIALAQARDAEALAESALEHTRAELARLSRG
jgi:DNA repair exonuclease SbcCD ATPase subunit